MFRRLLAGVLLVGLVVAGTVFAMHRTTTNGRDTAKLQVVASYYPLYDFAKRVGGNHVQVTNITPAGAEPHDYEPSPKVLADALQAGALVYNGGHMEPWASGFLADYTGKVVKASAGITLLPAADPHFWLDPVLAQHIVANIRDGLVKADPAHKGDYIGNARRYNAELAQLDADFRGGLASCQTRTIITSHAAFGYVGKRYNLDVVSIAGLSPDEEPSAGKLAALASLVRDKGIRYVFFESLASPRLADTIAVETGAKTLVFDPIEGLSNANQKQGQDYISVQRQNLQNLRTALGPCL